MTFEFRWLKGIAAVARSDWDALALPQSSPFLEWDWLEMLERTQCLGVQTGWIPYHLTLWSGSTLIAAAPLYIKTHSWGEFIFDQEWARVSEELGVPYYPKLVGTCPFTPASGYRFLTRPGREERPLLEMMLAEIDRFCTEAGIAGCHFLHVEAEWSQTLRELGVGAWLHHGLIWENQGFACFDDYLSSFTSHTRKNIRRERRAVAASGLRYEIIEGSRAGPELYAAAYAFYSQTCFRHWGGSRYLNEAFFLAIGEDYRHRPVFVVAFTDDEPQPIALSFLIHKGDRLYGRYWGCREEFAFLHFETCYYRPIEWAISQGVRYYDAGSGGATHKRRRGFPARPKYSLHRFYHPVLKKLWEVNIDRINEAEAGLIDQINQGT